jgi:monothiol glutaredoxin
MTVTDLAEKMQAQAITLVDVRGAEDRASASIDGSLVLDQETMDELERLPKDSELAFICHHGNASLGAAEYFRKRGFTRVSNVTGGIDAWSKEIDASVLTY